MDEDDDDAQERARLRLMANCQPEGAFYEPDALREHFPTAFGKQSAVSSSRSRSGHEEGPQQRQTHRSLPAKVPDKEQERLEESPRAPDSVVDADFIGPPPPTAEDADEDEEDDGDGDTGEDADQDEYKIPFNNEIALGGHSKVVSALAVDPTGSRVLTGSYDYTIRMYDFQGMDSTLKSFRHIEPSEGHQVRAISWSPSADSFLAVTGSAQAKLYDRDGLTIGEFIKGDMYIRDLKHTAGHISGLTGGHWHPSDKNTVLTSSEDGSLRIWDLSNFKNHKQVIKPKLARPGRVAVNSCAWGLSGKCVAGGLGDGSIQLWNIKPGWGSRPDIYLSKAHVSGEEVTAILFSGDGHTMVSRSTDSTLKIWDLRQAKAPLKVFEDLPCFYSQTNVAFSPDERLVVTGTSVGKKGHAGGGDLLFIDKRDLEVVRRASVSSSGSVVSCLWHTRLNQIFATSGDKQEGKTHVFYDPRLSNRGALVCAARAPRKKPVDEYEVRPVVRNPHALPMFRDEPSRKRQREKARSDPIKSRRPDLPINGPGHGGRVGTTTGSLLTQYLLRERGLVKETWMEEDPREAILKYAEIAANDPKFIAPAYAQTQPKPVFAEPEEEEEVEK